MTKKNTAKDFQKTAKDFKQAVDDARAIRELLERLTPDQIRALISKRLAGGKRMN